MVMGRCIDNGGAGFVVVWCIDNEGGFVVMGWCLDNGGAGFVVVGCIDNGGGFVVVCGY